MFIKLFGRRKKPPSPRLALAYEATVIRLLNRVSNRVRRWETQPLSRQKWQLILCLIGLIVLGSLSVYYTATGHFIIRINQKYHERPSSIRNAGPKPLRRK